MKVSIYCATLLRIFTEDGEDANLMDLHKQFFQVTLTMAAVVKKDPAAGNAGKDDITMRVTNLDALSGLLRKAKCNRNKKDALNALVSKSETFWSSS